MGCVNRPMISIARSIALVTLHMIRIFTRSAWLRDGVARILADWLLPTSQIAKVSTTFVAHSISTVLEFLSWHVSFRLCARLLDGSHTLDGLSVCLFLFCTHTAVY